jgi:hypothetical protein
VLSKTYALLTNDKFQHFVYGVAIYATLVPMGVPVAFVLLSLIALGKEIYDKKGYGTYEVKDALFTVAGGVYLESWYTLFEKLSVLF